MRLCLLLLILTLAIPLKAQEPYNSHFPDSNAVWYFTYNSQSVASAPTIYHYTMELLGDTTIQEKTYLRLFTTESRTTSPELSSSLGMYYEGAIREDSMENRAYFFPPTGEEEILLYDYNWKIGDTVTGHLASWQLPLDTIVSIDSVIVGNNYHKRWLINPCYGLYLIDGIGSNTGLINSSNGCILDASSTFLDCFQQEGKTLYPDTTKQCELPNPVIDYPEDRTGMTIYPNPTTSSVTVELDNGFFTHVKLIDQVGNIVFSSDAQGQKSIELSEMKRGLYFLQCIDSNGRIFSSKIVCNP